MSRPLPCAALLVAMALVPRNVAATAEPRWIRLDSTHFSVLTDADEKRGREVIVRFEQMRAAFAQLLYKSRVNMPEPIEIIAFKSEDEYEKVAPTRQGEGLGTAFFIPGDDRYYFVLNLSKDESWRAISGDFARVLLNYNYPPTQSWFDRGFTEYFSSLRLSDKQMELGGDPMQGSAQSFVGLLQQSNWLSLADLFARTDRSLQQDVTTQPVFEAESWIVMHYLLNKEKLPAVGSYFGMVEIEKLPVEEALQKAFGMSSAQLQKDVKDYFHSISAKLQTQGTARPSAGDFQNSVPAPITADVIGTSTHEMSVGEAQALVAEMSLRVPEHRDEALKELESIIDQPKTDNVAAHRALAWDFMQKKDYEHAIEELGNASADIKDPMTHYYLALCKYRQAQSSGGEMKGLANMIQDLHAVLDWDHEFAEAYYMLAVAQTEGGGLRAASDSIRAAIQLSPRRPDYLLELARIYEAGKNWDAATALLENLAGNSNWEIASAAKKDLHDLPYIKKYGIPPVSDAASAGSQKGSPGTGSAAAMPPVAQQQSTQNETASPQAAELSGQGNDEAAEQAPATPQIDRRPIHYAKGKLISVDCSQAPAAVVTVAAGTKTMRFRTSDYKSLMLVGAETFSCDWANRLVSVNYKAGGKADGDLVSLEVH